MKVAKLGGAMFDSNVYLAYGDRTAALIDAGTGLMGDDVARSVEKALGGLKLDKLVLTHRHFDHTGGAAALAERFKVPIFAHREAKAALEQGDGELTGAWFFSGAQTPIKVKAMAEGDSIELGGEKFDVLDLPGHSPCSMGLYSKKLSSLFCGDVIFCDGGVGRWDLAGGDFGPHAKSIKRVAGLEAKNLYPGHGRHEEGGGAMEAKLALASIQMM